MGKKIPTKTKEEMLKFVYSISPIEMPLKAWVALVNKVKRMKG